MKGGKNVAKKKKRKLTYWQRVYLTLKIRTKRLLSSILQSIKQYKMPLKLKLIVGSIILLIALFYGGKFAIHHYRISSQTDYGYTKEEAQIILDKKLQPVTKEFGYSQAFIQAVINNKYDEKYTPLYFYTNTVNEDSKKYYDKLLAKSYTQEQVKDIFKNLSLEEMVPLFIYDKQEDLQVYYKDVKKGTLTDDYLKLYENPVIQTTLSIDSLVNKKYGLEQNFEPEALTSINQYCAFNPGKLVKEAAAAFTSMCMDAKEQNIMFASMTAYRSYSEQQKRYDYYASEYGSLQVDDYTSRPGFDEHQSGLAVNVASMAAYEVETPFVNSNEYAWLQEHVAEYGFIFRYPSGKSHITGMSSEPSHLRYVGIELAQALKELNITLEEYHALYK